MSERPTQVEIDEANASRCQELELALEALEKKLAEQQAIMQLANTAFTRTADEYRNDYLRGGSVQVSDLRVEAWRAIAKCDSEELTKREAAARQQGFEEAEKGGVRLAIESVQRYCATTEVIKLGAAHKAGRDEVLKELSEQEPVAYMTKRGAVYKGKHCSDDELALYAHPPIREGWVMVPLEPTREMLDAAHQDFWSGKEIDKLLKDAYRLMLSAVKKD